MYLYNLTLQRATGVVCACYGSFMGKGGQEVVVGRGKVLELLRVDEGGKLVSVVSVEVFGAIRALVQFRLTGSSKDYVVVGSDSGRIVILEYNRERNAFEVVHKETFGKSGCRRIVPGQYLAVDPKGRAVMVGACEKQKLVYVLNRDNAARLTISSPLEAHKSHTLVFSLVGIDCGFDNPLFAAIELDYSEADTDTTGQAAMEAQKHLTFYELDLGLNHVVRKWSDPVDNGANLLVTVPGGADGPSGVLVCADNFVIYRPAEPGARELRALIPRRTDLPPDRGVLVVAAATHRQKNVFFFLLQTEYGDIFKATLEPPGSGAGEVAELRVKYFDTIPTCAALCVLKSGFLLAASETGNHKLYQFMGIGDGEDGVVSSSASLEEADEEGNLKPVFFTPRRLLNLASIDEADSLMPIMDMKVANLFDEETSQVVAACGRGGRSSLRVLRAGLAVTEMAVSALPAAPTAVWTVRRSAGDEFDAYIVVSFPAATLVLSVGDTVEEVSDSGFAGGTSSLAVALLGQDTLVQVHPGGIRQVRPDGRVNEWKTPAGKKTVVKVCHNSMQLVLGLSGGDVYYFEMNSAAGGGQLMELEKREMAGDVACLAVAPVPPGRHHARFLAVGSYDNTIRLLSLDAKDCMSVLSVQVVPSPPESLLLLSVRLQAAAAAGGADDDTLFLNAGLQNGVLLRTEVDVVTGQLSDTRTRFLGLRAPRLFTTSIRGAHAMLCLSSRPWLGYVHHARFLLTPLSYEALEHAALFSSDQCAEGIVAIAGDALRIFTIDRLGDAFNQTCIPLRYTPRKMILHPKRKSSLIIIEADQGAYSTEEEEQLRKSAASASAASSASAAATATGTAAGTAGTATVTEMEVDETGSGAPADVAAAADAAAALAAAAAEAAATEAEETVAEEQYGSPRADHRRWVSCIRVLDAKSGNSTCLLELQENEAALNVCAVNFHDKSMGTLIAVGTAKDLEWLPRRTATCGFVHIYRLVDEGRALELVHKTQLDGVPTALSAFQGRLLVGMGPVLRIYDLGKRKLLRKCENKSFPNTIVSIHTFSDRIYVGDIQESFHYVKYRREENQLYIFADDSSPRWLTAALHVDFDTMAAADKFGNIFFVRLPQDLSEEIEDDPTGGKIKWEQGRLNGAPNKVEEIIQFHVGDVVTCMQKASLIPGGMECVIFGTVMGSIGALLPFISREDVDFFSHLEMHLRQEHPPLCGRDHMAFRSAYFPVKDVIDGDLCEQYSTLTPELQRKIADELDRTPGEIMKKLEDIRNRII